MAKCISQRWFFLLLLHAILLLASTHSSASASTSTSTSQKDIDLIGQICSSTTNNDLCIQALESDPRSLNSDVEGLARIILDLVVRLANQALVHVGQLFGDNKDVAWGILLGKCIEILKKAVTEDLPHSMTALDSKNFEASKQAAEDVRDDFTICQGLVEAQSPAYDQCKLVHDLSVVASNILSTLGLFCQL